MLGDALLGFGTPRRSRRALSEARGVAAGTASGWVGLGQCYERLAQETFAGIEKAAPESAYMLARSANVRVTQQQISSAFYLYKQAIEKEPGNARRASGLG